MPDLTRPNKWLRFSICLTSWRSVYVAVLSLGMAQRSGRRERERRWWWLLLWLHTAYKHTHVRHTYASIESKFVGVKFSPREGESLNWKYTGVSVCKLITRSHYNNFMFHVCPFLTPTPPTHMWTNECEKYKLSVACRVPNDNITTEQPNKCK